MLLQLSTPVESPPAAAHACALPASRPAPSQRDCWGMPNCPHAEVAALADSYRRRREQLQAANGNGTSSDISSLLELVPCDVLNELRDNSTLWMIGDRYRASRCSDVGAG